MREGMAARGTSSLPAPCAGSGQHQPRPRQDVSPATVGVPTPGPALSQGPEPSPAVPGRPVRCPSPAPGRTWAAPSVSSRLSRSRTRRSSSCSARTAPATCASSSAAGPGASSGGLPGSPPAGRRSAGTGTGTRVAGQAEHRPRSPGAGTAHPVSHPAASSDSHRAPAVGCPRHSRCQPSPAAPQPQQHPGCPQSRAPLCPSSAAVVAAGGQPTTDGCSGACGSPCDTC